MIPKTIHYCWFGGNPMPEEIEKYISTWHTYCSDYNFVCWDESNFDINTCEFTRKAYGAKKWAFLSDYVRLWAVYNYGGIYLDVDVEVLKSLDDLLIHDYWFAREDDSVNTGIGFGACKGNEIIRKNLSVYENMEFRKGEFKPRPCPYYTTMILKEHGYSSKIRTNVLSGGG